MNMKKELILDEEELYSKGGIHRKPWDSVYLEYKKRLFPYQGRKFLVHYDRGSEDCIGIFFIDCVKPSFEGLGALFSNNRKEVRDNDRRERLICDTSYKYCRVLGRGNQSRKFYLID